MEAKKNPDKDVNRKSRQFFLIGLSISITLMIVAFEWKTEYIEVCVLPAASEANIVLADVAPLKIKFPKPAHDIPIKQKAAPTNFIPIEVKAEATNDDSDTPKLIDMDSLSYTPYSVPLEDTPEVDTSFFIWVEDQPTPIGGFNKFYKELGSKIKYPTQAKRTETEGRVFVEFIVNAKGDPTDLKVLKGIGAGCDEEAMRVLASMKWNPGKQRGRAVRVKMIIPVNFRLH